MILRKILEQKRSEIEAITKPKRSLSKVLSQPGLSVIAEIKKASPSKGIISGDLDVEKTLTKYITGGADAVSILTDRIFFAGDISIIGKLRPVANIPILRKDFLIAPVQIFESLFAGADALLLIVAALDGDSLKELLSLTESLGMEALVEVHTTDELVRVLDTQARVIGFNNRNLADFSVDLKTSEHLMNELMRREPDTKRLIVSESGISTVEDAVFLRNLGVHGILVGEALIRSDNPAELIAEFKKNAGGAGK